MAKRGMGQKLMDLRQGMMPKKGMMMAEKDMMMKPMMTEKERAKMMADKKKAKKK